MQANACIACSLAEPFTQLLIQQGIAFELIGWCEGVHVGKFWPRDGNHLAGGIQLHGARAEWNHAAIECQIFVAQLTDVSQHAGFGMVAVENWVRQISTGAAQVGGYETVAAFFKGRPIGRRLAFLRKAGPERFNVLA